MAGMGQCNFDQSTKLYTEENLIMSGWITLKMNFATTLCEEEMELMLPARTAETAVQVLAGYEKSPWQQGANGWALQRDVVVTVEGEPITIRLGLQKRGDQYVLALRDKEFDLRVYEEHQLQGEAVLAQLPELIGSLLKAEADLIAYDVLHEYYDRQRIPVELDTREFQTNRLRLTADERQARQYVSICA
jgi:hypothetical protein